MHSSTDQSYIFIGRKEYLLCLYKIIHVVNHSFELDT